MKRPEVPVTALEAYPVSAVTSRAEGAEPTESPWKRLDRLLKGRYLLAILLGLVGLAGGGYLGWKSTEPLYQSVELVRFKSTMPSYADPEGNRPMPDFDHFVRWYRLLLESPRATAFAMSDPNWQQKGWPNTGAEAVARFEESRSIVHPKHTGALQIQFMDPDPEVAVAGARALVSIFKDFTKEKSSNEVLSVTQVTNQLRGVDAEIADLDGRINKATEDYGDTESLKRFHGIALERWIETNEESRRFRLLLRQHEVMEKEAEQETGEARPQKTAEDLAGEPDINRLMIELERERLRQAKLEGLPERHRDREALPDVIGEIDILQRALDRIVARHNEQKATIASGGVPRDQIEIQLEALEGEMQRMTDELNKLRSILVAVTRHQTDIDRLERERERLKFLQEQLEGRFDEEARIEFPTEAPPVPTRPFKDLRIKMAAAGAAAGGGLGVLLVLLLGFMDRRLRSTVHLEQGPHAPRLRVLGLLPTLPKSFGDREGEEIAIHCVHHIRTLLQLSDATEPGACLGVTSPGAGSGKTTLTTALGLSFAASGAQTLLVDADLTGRSLTRVVARMLLADLRRRAERLSEPGSNGASAGSVYLLEPLVPPREARGPATPEEMRSLLASALDGAGLHEARRSGLIQDVFAVTDLVLGGEGREALEAQLMSTLAAEDDDLGAPSAWVPLPTLELAPGRASINGTSIERYVYRTGHEGLRFLPLRGFGWGGNVSPVTIAALLERLRRDFDVVLFDTGPVPGTLETSMVAAHTDANVVVVSHGDPRPDFQRTLTYLDEVGARVAGVVFNRAGKKEVFRSSLSRGSSRTEDTTG